MLSRNKIDKSKLSKSELEIYTELESKTACINLMTSINNDNKLNKNEIIELCSNINDIILNNKSVKLPGTNY